MRIGRPMAALVVAGGILWFAYWFDGQVLRDIQRQDAVNFDIRPLAWAAPFGYLVSAGGVLAVAILAWWSRSLVVGIVYVLAGAFFAFLWTLTWIFSATANGTPPIFPKPVATFIGNLSGTLDQGPTRSVYVVGAGLLLAGLGAIGLAIQRRVAPRA